MKKDTLSRIVITIVAYAAFLTIIFGAAAGFTWALEPDITVKDGSSELFVYVMFGMVIFSSCYTLARLIEAAMWIWKKTDG